MNMDPKNVGRLDANESAFFARQLEFVKAKSYDVKYPQFKAINGLIPISSEVDSGAETVTYYQYDTVGMAKIVANYADDLPRCDVKGKEFTSKVRDIGAAYGYNHKEIRRARMAGLPLEQRKANATKRAHDQKTENIAWFGDSVNGIIGFLYNANIPVGNAPTGGWGAATADQIVADMMDAVDKVNSQSNGVEVANTLLIPLKYWGKISGTRMAAGTDTTILQFFKANRPNVVVDCLVQLDALSPLPSGAAGPGAAMVAYDRSPDTLTLELPMRYTALAPEERNLEQVVNTVSTVAGVLIYYPLACKISENL